MMRKLIPLLIVVMLVALPCAALAVEIDIKPGSCPNPLNTNARGVLPVAILGAGDFDVSSIDPASVRLEGVAPLRWSYEDVATPYAGTGEGCFACHESGPDGYMDLTLKFNAQEIVTALGDVEDGECRVVMLTAAGLSGEDVVRIIKKGPQE